jgi:thioredoxin 1
MKNLKTKQMVTVKKFSAVWCGPCRALTPVMNEIKGNYSNVKFEEYDIDEYSDITEEYGVRSVPTVIIVKDGIEVNRFTGLSSKMAYTNAINEAIK